MLEGFIWLWIMKIPWRRPFEQEAASATAPPPSRPVWCQYTTVLGKNFYLHVGCLVWAISFDFELENCSEKSGVFARVCRRKSATCCLCFGTVLLSCCTLCCLHILFEHEAVSRLCFFVARCHMLAGVICLCFVTTITTYPLTYGLVVC